MAQSVSWQESYKLAVLELDHSKLQQRIDDARAILQQRIEELQVSSHSTDHSMKEQRAIEDALRLIQTLEQVELRSHLATRSHSDNPLRAEAL